MPTALGDAQFAKDATSQDTEGNYKTENGLPWAMLLQGSVYVPREKVGIDSVFNYFQAWALSGGQVNQDWYLDMPGYINKDKIK
jgi:LruC domain-containing protein